MVVIDIGYNDRSYHKYGIEWPRFCYIFDRMAMVLICVGYNDHGSDRS